MTHIVTPQNVPGFANAIYVLNSDGADNERDLDLEHDHMVASPKKKSGGWLMSLAAAHSRRPQSSLRSW